MAQRDSSLHVAHVADELLVFAPVFADFDPECQIHSRVQPALDFSARGLADRLELSLGVRAEVLDGPGTRWSSTPDADLPGERVAAVVVRVRPGRSGPVDRARVEALVASVCPVHVECVVEVLPEEGP